MNRLFAISLLALGLLPALASAQSPAPSAPVKDALPPGPLIVSKMPDFAQWTIDSTYSDAPKAGQPSALDRFKQQALADPSLAKAMQDPQYVFTILNIRPVHILVTKTNDTLHEERTFQQGYQGEMWGNSKFVIEKRPNLSALIAVININSGDAFPDFDWVSKKTFTGMQTHSRLKCMSFKEDRYNDQHEFIGTAYAYVDVATRYPVGYQFQTETREYAFLAPPTAAQSIPDDYMAAANAMMDHLQKAIPHLATP